MRRIVHFFLCLLSVWVLMGCAGDGYTPALRAVDTLMTDHPDSALTLLDYMKDEAESWSRSHRMRYHLHERQSGLLFYKHLSHKTKVIVYDTIFPSANRHC